MSSEPAILLRGLGKCYQIYERPRDRLLQMLYRGRRRYYREFWALRGIDLQVMPGEVIGIIGKNGSGKSTLLQLVCGTLTPTVGQVMVKGRVAALLELGAGFNAEFTGRENVFLSAAVSGMEHQEIVARFDEIVDFSGIRDFIDQPVKTYSSGMYVRLAFSVAINVDPDILVIDEALAVGDGEFSRKSFDRIMQMKTAGKTILFCSHALYQIEAFCDRVIWLDGGASVLQGYPQEVVPKYNISLLKNVVNSTKNIIGKEISSKEAIHNGTNIGFLKNYDISIDGISGRDLVAHSCKSDLVIQISYYADPQLPPPVIGVTIDYEEVITATSAISRSDGVAMSRDASGFGRCELIFPELPLRKGRYWISLYLGCENALHIYDEAVRVVSFEIHDSCPEPGIVAIPHRWVTGAE